MSEPDRTKPGTTTVPDTGSAEDRPEADAATPADRRPAAGPSLDLPLSSPD